MSLHQLRGRGARVGFSFLTLAFPWVFVFGWTLSPPLFLFIKEKNTSTKKVVIFACPLRFGETFSLGLAHWVHLVLLCFRTVFIGKTLNGMKHTEVLHYLKFLLESFQLQFLFLLLLRKWGALEVGTPQPKKAPRPVNSTFFHFPIQVQHLMYDLVSAGRRGFSGSNCERETASPIGEQKENRTVSTWRLLNRETRDWLRCVYDVQKRNSGVVIKTRITGIR